MPTAASAVNQSYVLWATEALNSELQSFVRYEDYYLGDHPLEFATDRWKEVFGNVFEQFADNWCQVVVDAMVQRLEIIGWRSEDDDSLAKLAEEIWDDNELEVEEDDLHTQTAVKGDGYLIVWPDPEDESRIQIFYNDATQVAVQYDPANRRRIARATKRYDQLDGTRWLCIYLPDQIQKWVIPSSFSDIQILMVSEGWESVPSGWQLAETIANPTGQVPVFHFKNRALGSTHGVSELKSVIPVQNTVNKLMMDMMVGSEFGSYRQKYIAGGGQPKDGWKAGAMRLWATTDPNAKFGEFGQIDLEPLVRAIDLAVGHIAKITQTPLHYLRSSGDMPSGEALKTSESGLVKKCRARQKAWGSSWSKAMTYAVGLQQGDKPQSPVFPVWESPETRHVLEQAQTAQLKSILGIPLTQLWSEHFGYSEEEIAQFEETNKAVAAAVLAQVIAQMGQLPPGTEQVTATPDQLIQLLKQANTVGNADEGKGLNISQILALLPKSITGQSSAGEVTTKPQPNSSPSPSPTRRSTGFRD